MKDFYFMKNKCLEGGLPETESLEEESSETESMEAENLERERIEGKYYN